MTGIEGSKAAPAIYIGRWTPKILFSLHGRPYRHGELRRQMGRISQRMLTRTLRNLESTGLIARRVTISKTISVEYSLTQRGKTIIVPLLGMCRWARRYGREVIADVHLQDVETNIMPKILRDTYPARPVTRNSSRSEQEGNDPRGEGYAYRK